MHVTGGDLPDGVDVWIEESGYRVTPFRFVFPIGPLFVPGRCRDRSTVLPDGTLVNEFEVVTLGVPIPFARLTFRVRPVAVAPEPAGAPAAVPAPA